MEAPFYIGQEVICVRPGPHHKNILFKYQHYIIYSMLQCRCGEWIVDVGIKDQNEEVAWTCPVCEGGILSKAPVMYFAHFRFAPIYEISDTTIDEIINQEDNEDIQILQEPGELVH